MSAKKFYELVKGSRINTFLYHFTDTDNLASITADGLLSKKRLRDGGIAPRKPGGNDWSWEADEKKGIFDYISLCLIAEHPMAWQIKADGRVNEIKYIRIDPIVILTEGAMLCCDIANKAGTEIVSVEEALQRLDMEVIYSRTDWKNKEVQARRQAAKRCELLIPGRIDPSLFR